MKTELIKLKENISLNVAEDTQYVLDFGKFAPEGKYELELVFNTPGVSSEIIGLYKLSKNQTLNLTTIANHQAPNTSCMTHIKGVLEDKTTSDYVGKILIDKKAQQTSSYLADAVLVVGEDTHNNSQPILEIEADDVKASHGATTGRINRDHIYYLESRGFSETEAKGILVEAFFESLLSKIEDEKIKQEVKKTLK